MKKMKIKIAMQSFLRLSASKKLANENNFVSHKRKINTTQYMLNSKTTQRNNYLSISQ